MSSRNLGPASTATTNDQALSADPVSLLPSSFTQNALAAYCNTPPGSAAVAAALGTLTATTAIPLTGIFGYNPINYLKSRAAFAKMRAGAANMRVLLVGDSTEIGRAAASSNSYSGAYPYSPGARLTAMLNAAIPGVAARSAAWVGNAVTYGLDNNYDTRNTIGAGWSGFAANSCLGYSPDTNTTTTNALVHATTGAYNIDSAEIGYIDVGTGQFSASINGNGVVNKTCTSTNTILTAAVGPTTAGANITLARVSGNIYLTHAIGWSSATPEIQVVPAGWAGAKLSDLVLDAGTYSPLKHWKVLAPNLSFLRVGINDWGNATDLASFAANLQVAITAAKLSGDIVLETSFPTQASQVSLANQAAYNALIFSVAQANGVAVLDHWSSFISYEACGPLGCMDSDGVHGLKAGYDMIAARRAAFVRLLSQ